MVSKNTQNDRYNQKSLLSFEVISISHNSLAMFVKLLETVHDRFFQNRSKHQCHIDVKFPVYVQSIDI